MPKGEKKYVHTPVVIFPERGIPGTYRHMINAIPQIRDMTKKNISPQFQRRSTIQNSRVRSAKQNPPVITRKTFKRNPSFIENGTPMCRAYGTALHMGILCLFKCDIMSQFLCMHRFIRKQTDTGRYWC